jgi:hypothetical protein
VICDGGSNLPGLGIQSIVSLLYVQSLFRQTLDGEYNQPGMARP